MTFGDRLKKIRQEKNISREELAKKLKISYSAISKYETNTRFPDQQTLLKISKILGTTTDYLLGRINDDNVPVEKLYPEVNDIEEAMKIIMEQPGLMLNGELLTDEDKMILANSIQIGLRLAEERRRKRENKK